MELPGVSREVMREMDRRAVEEFGYGILQMMENAGRSLAQISTEVTDMARGSCVLLAGNGNNGGGGLVAVRHLTNWGAEVKVVVPYDESEMSTATRRQRSILKEMEVEVTTFDKDSHLRHLDDFSLVVDCLIGYGLRGNPRSPLKEAIDQINSLQATVLSLDTPSGLDVDTGQPADPCAKADYTVALAYPKRGLVSQEAKEYVGQLFLVDIGIPRLLYEQLQLKYPFEEKRVLRLSY